MPSPAAFQTSSGTGSTISTIQHAARASAQGIAFHIPADGQKVLVTLHGKRLESSLVQVAAAGTLPVRVPALRVSEGDPAGEGRELAILPRPKHHVPVIGHEAIREQPHSGPIDGFLQDLLEGLIIGIFAEDGHPLAARFST